MWVTLGLFNLLVASPLKRDISKLVRWCEDRELPYELWPVRNGRILTPKFPEPRQTKGSWRKILSELAKINLPPEVHEAVQEYCPLMASTIARSELLNNEIASDLLKINENLFQSLPRTGTGTPSDVRYQTLGQILTMNAGLSRFAAQTFAGTTRITETECHYWSNSLLGIGTAALGLWRLCRFLDKTLGEMRVPERFAQLRLVTEFPDLTKEDPEKKDYLGEVKLSTKDLKPVVPLLAFFSARDGYRSTETTISAPLAAVSSCNSLRWSLLTITHEITHVTIRGVLSDLYPDLNDETDLQKALDLIEAKRRAPTLFDEIRRILFFTIIKMDDVVSERSSGESTELDLAIFRRLLERWRHDVDETLVHTFDFLYFYGIDVERYVRGIWMSWGTIPNVSNRIRDYVLRTICAVMAKHIRKGPHSEELAKKAVLQSLRGMDAAGGGDRYVKLAIKYIEEDWERKIKPAVRARRQLIKIVLNFLFSTKVATAVRGEPEISGDASEKEGYTLRRGYLELKQIRNPLRFLELYTEAKQPSAAESLWMYYVLAFCISEDE